jgi:hypothetical protein
MNFTFLFAAIAALTFKVQFSVDDNSRQDYFLFQGDDQSAHLHRQNQTLYLHLIQGNDVEVYEMSLQTAGTNFYFSWLNYMVDEDPMMLVKRIGRIVSMDFYHFTFISPLYDASDDYNCDIETYYNLKEINYWFIAGIVLIVAILCKSTQVTQKILISFLRKSGLFNQATILLEDVIADEMKLDDEMNSENDGHDYENEQS